MARPPRLKPAPIPAIRPVPEYAADARLSAVYKETKAGLNAPWMGVVAMAFAQYPTFYAALWSAIAPLAGRARFAEACAALRAEAAVQAEILAPRDLRAEVARLGYGAAELEEIRATTAVFAHGNMPYLLMATLARRLLEGCAWAAEGAPGAPQPGHDWPRPPLMEPHHADAPTQAVYRDIQATLGLPFVNTDYRALARWPSYFTAAWSDLKRIVTAAGYEAAVAAQHDKAMAEATGLPNASGLTPDALIAAAEADATLDEVREVVRLFQWLLPGLTVNVACLSLQIGGDPADP